tara:strand:- start:3679 stop:4089 length:411 start_codon:yes stop_codon:yes gene_type:complete
MKKVRGYNFSREFMGERVPQHIQNIVIRQHCKNMKLHYLLSSTEYSMKNSSLIFDQIIEEIRNLHGVVVYSIFQLPENNFKRNKIYSKFIKNRKTLYFANEGFKISNHKDAYRVEMIWLIKKNLINCPKANDIWVN